MTIGRSTVALIGFSAFTLLANGQLPPLAQMLQRLSASGVQGPGPGILNPNSPGYNANNNPVTLLDNGLRARSAPAASGAFGSLLANKSGLYRAILVAAYQLRFNTPLISDTPSFPSEATAVGQYVPASAVTKVASYLRNGTEATQPAPTPTSLGFWNGLNEFYLGASDGALMVYNAATFHSDTDVNNYVNSITPQYGQAANVIAHIGVYSAYAAIALAAAPYVASGARAGYSGFMAKYPAMYVWAPTSAGSAVIGGTIAGIASGGDPAAIAQGAFFAYVTTTPGPRPGRPNAPGTAVPATPAEIAAARARGPIPVAQFAPVTTPANSPMLQRYLSGSGGRWGGTATRQLNHQLATDLETRGFTVTNGAGRGPEQWIRGPGGGTTGGTWVDITARNGTQWVRIQTVDTLADGVTLTAREAAAAARIRATFPNDLLVLVSKQTGLVIP